MSLGSLGSGPSGAHKVNQSINFPLMSVFECKKIIPRMEFMLSARASVSLTPLQMAQRTGGIRANQHASLRLHLQNHKEPLENEKFK